MKMEATNNQITFTAPPGLWREGDRIEQNFGRSMLDPLHPERSIPSGAVMIVRPIIGKHIEWGEIYCLQTTNGTMVKRLYPGKDSDHLKCVSSNEDEGFLPYEIPKSKILSIERVIYVIFGKPF